MALPPGWTAVFDDASGEYFFWHVATVRAQREQLVAPLSPSHCIHSSPFVQDTTQWDRPVAGAAGGAAAGAGGAAAAPAEPEAAAEEHLGPAAGGKRKARGECGVGVPFP